MIKKILMGASFLALLAAYPAFAETKPAVDTTKEKVENALSEAGESISDTTEKAGEAVKEAYTDVKAYFTDDKDIKIVTSVNVTERITADELIGASVQNPKGYDIGKIEDILISKSGNAQTVIINDGGVLGLGGKLAAFDYDIIQGITASDNIVVKLSEASLKKATAFQYEKPTRSDKKIHVMPADMYSVKKMIDAKVVDPKDKAVAKVDTIAFDGNEADYLIITFNTVLGMGGEKAALNLDAIDLIDKDGKYSFKLNAKQTAQFENYKKEVKTY